MGRPATEVADKISWYCVALLGVMLVLNFCESTTTSEDQMEKLDVISLMRRACDEIYVVGERETLQSISEKCGDPENFVYRVAEVDRRNKDRRRCLKAEEGESLPDRTKPPRVPRLACLSSIMHFERMTIVGQLAWGFVSTSKMVTRVTPSFSFLSPINMWDSHFISNISKNICRIAAYFAQGSTTAKIIISKRTVYRRRILPAQIHQDLHTPLQQMSSESSARSYGSSCSSSSPAHFSAGPARSSATPSPLNQYPLEQRGSKEFQCELASLSVRLSQPISPGSAITSQGALNIARVENSMPVDLYKIPASLRVEELLNCEPAPLDKEQADEILRGMVEERAARLRQAAANNLDPIHVDSESTDSDLGSAYYDTKKKGKEPVATEYPILGLEDEEDGSHWSYDSPQSEELELEGERIIKKQILPDGEESSTATEEVKVLSCRDLPTSLTQKYLAEHIEQFQLEGHVVLPLPHMRCYRFNNPENGGRVPRMVLSTFLLRLGISSPLHPFIKDVCEYYQLTPLQINPNGYRVALALYIIQEKINADSLLDLPKADRDIRKLITISNLVVCGFLKEGVRLTPQKKKSRKRARKEMAISPIPFMEEAEQAATSGPVQPAAATTTARSQANPPACMTTLTEHLRGSGPSPRLKRHRSHKDGKTSDPDPKKVAPSDAPLPTSSSVSTVAATFVRLTQGHISDQDVEDWSSSALEANQDALSRAAAEVYDCQLSKAREIRALSQTNTNLDFKVKSLQSKVAEHGQDKVTLVNSYNQKMLNLNAAHEKALREQKEAHDLAAEAWKKEKDSLEERVLELEGSVSTLTEGREADLADARNLVVRNYMKIFIKKVPDFDWAALGASTARNAEKLKLEIERDAQIAEEARLAAEHARVVADEAREKEADNP
ncbi:hypothetical protein AgCh_036393 [Apium graveolens]